MNDLEMTRLCAEAMGYAKWSDHQGGLPGFTKETGIYDPLHDDAQAMGLVKKFCLHIGKTLRTPDNTVGDWIVSNTDQCLAVNPDLNRAIVECVARMQAERKA